MSRTLRWFVPGILACSSAWATPVPISASGQTQPFAATSATVGSAAVWLHPTDLTQSLILGVNGVDGLVAYGLDGGAQAPAVSGLFTTVDVRYGFPLSGQEVSLVATGARDGTLSFYALNSSTRLLQSLPLTQALALGASVSCAVLWHPTGTSDYELFAFGGSSLRNWALKDDGAGRILATELGSAVSTAGSVTGCAVDEPTQSLYYTVASQGLLRIRFLPDGGSINTVLANVGGTDTAIGSSVAGVSLLRTSGGGSVLISSPGPSGNGNTVFSAYDRLTSAPVGSFQLPADGGFSAVQLSAGLASTNMGLGVDFPQGMLVLHDGRNAGLTPNFKLVSWGAVASALGLGTDSVLDPRAEGPPLLADGGVAPADGGSSGSSSGASRPTSTSAGFPPQSTGCGCRTGAVSAPLGVLSALGLFRCLRRRQDRGRSPALEG